MPSIADTHIEMTTHDGDGGLWCLKRCEASSLDDGNIETTAGDLWLCNICNITLSRMKLNKK